MTEKSSTGRKQNNRPAMQNTPAADLERALTCCQPIPCGWPLGTRDFRQLSEDWDEERRGWTSL
jgi:hypothetical protein